MFANYLFEKKHQLAEPEDPAHPLLAAPAKPQGDLTNPLIPQPEYSLTLGYKQYELTNHLGNVQVTLSDRKLGLVQNENSSFSSYTADVLSAVDYYPFGMAMPGRSVEGGYRYGFNTQEKVKEIEGNHFTAQFWEYDARLGRRWNLDPLVNPSESLYATNNNNPIKNNDSKRYCSICPDNRRLVFSYSLGGGGFSLSLYAGTSAQNNSAMAGLNASATFYSSGAGTSTFSPNLFTHTISPSFTFGGVGIDRPMNLNTFTSSSGSGVNTTFKNSFTISGNLILSSGFNSDGSGRTQWIGYHGFKLGDFSMGHYNDQFIPCFGLFGMGTDQFNSAGLNAQIRNGDYNLSWFNNMYYGMSKVNATWSDDIKINGQNYDKQKLFDVMLNNGRENITLSSETFGILQSGTGSGYQTFYPTNTMHNHLKELDKPTNKRFSFHHLYVPYPNTQQRLIPYFNSRSTLTR